VVPPNKEQREQLKEWLELADDIRDGGTDIVEGIGHVDVEKTPDLRKAYARGDATCHLYVTLEVGRRELHAGGLWVRFERFVEGVAGMLDIQDLRPGTSEVRFGEKEPSRYQQD
jgi:hypothetical protein